MSQVTSLDEDLGKKYLFISSNFVYIKVNIQIKCQKLNNSKLK